LGTEEGKAITFTRRDRRKKEEDVNGWRTAYSVTWQPGTGILLGGGEAELTTSGVEGT